jgi:hypothetical protein
VPFAAKAGVDIFRDPDFAALWAEHIARCHTAAFVFEFFLVAHFKWIDMLLVLCACSLWKIKIRPGRVVFGDLNSELVLHQFDSSQLPSETKQEQQHVFIFALNDDKESHSHLIFLYRCPNTW